MLKVYPTYSICKKVFCEHDFPARPIIGVKEKFKFTLETSMDHFIWFSKS